MIKFHVCLEYSKDINRSPKVCVDVDGGEGDSIIYSQDHISHICGEIRTQMKLIPVLRAKSQNTR